MIVTALAVALAASAVLVAVPGRPRRRWRRLTGRVVALRINPGPVAAGLVPVLGFLLLGTIGLVVGAALAPVALRQVAVMRTVAERRREDTLVRQAPLALDLVAAVLAAGRSAEAAVHVVALHTPPPLGAELRSVAARLRVSADPVPVWRSLDGTALEPVGRAFARSEASGAAVVPLVVDAADDLRRRARAVRRADVARVGVRTTLPMGLCLLPAFVLVGIAPTVLAVLTSLGR